MKNKIQNTPTGEAMIGLVTRAIEIIRAECHNITVENKIAYNGVDEDFVTNGDKKAQAMYISEIHRLFPTYGIIAEEKELAIPCTDADHDIYFTVDPLDGTKAYKRQQSHGVGTMLALVRDGKVIASYIGDANTGEIYGYDESLAEGEAKRVRFGRTSLLKPETDMPLPKQYVLLREAPHTFPANIAEIIMPAKDGGVFKDIEVSGGSIGTFMARLWKGEAGAIILDPGFDTPWDLTPVVGISQKLGFEFYKLGPDGSFKKHQPELVRKVTAKQYYEIIVHKTLVGEMKQWLAVRKKRETVGIDIGDTIVERSGDTRQAFPDALRVIKRLVAERFGNNSHIVSKVNAEQMIRVRKWLDENRFHELTGLPASNVEFCAERHEKAPICEKLGITHFIDDRPEVISHMTSVPHRFLFRPNMDDYERLSPSLKGSWSSRAGKKSNPCFWIRDQEKIVKTKMVRGEIRGPFYFLFIISIYGQFVASD
ncbi:MAG: hypothetical protein PHF79_03360 [Candidatus Pacebacteria bacterium]|nr:hypothetical protein [Candidatus Paceibacterota bacterium]